MARKQRAREIRRGDGYVTTRVTAQGGVRYQARWHDGERWRSQTFATDNAAYDHLRTAGRHRRSGTYTPESMLTVSEAVADYLERGSRRWSTNTYSTYEAVARLHIDPHIGSVRIVDLTPLRVQQWVDRLAGRPHSLSAASIENARVVLNGTCKAAMRLGVIMHNPVTGAALPARERRAYVTWSRDEVARVLNACEGDLMHAYYVIALTTAIRPGEIRALMWSDIDFERARMLVRRTITRDERGRQVLGTTTKTGRTRTIALTPEAIDALTALRADQRIRRMAASNWRALNLVFDRGDGNILPQKSVARAHQRICVDARVPIIRLHDLRHTAATLLLEAGTHVKIVADLLGHSSVTITLDTYSHPSESLQREAVSVLGAVVKRRA